MTNHNNSETIAITKTTGASLIETVKDLQDIANVFVKSGFFPDTTDIMKAQD